MTQFTRLILRVTTTVLGISIVVVLLAGGFWYMWQDSRGRAPQIGYTITARKLERAGLGMYLRARAAEVDSPANRDESREVTFVVESGETVSTVAYHLHGLGLVTDAELFRRVVQYWGADSDIQAGVYSLRANMTMEEIMRQLQHGRMPTTTVTVPEGWRAEQIGKLLEETGLISAQEFVQSVALGRTDYEFLRDRAPGSPLSLEGFLFPDTYELPQQTMSERIIDIMLQNWDQRVPSELRGKASDLGMTMYEIVSLASIVEREAVVSEERPLIAGVYLNRLEKGMYLQSDPTVQYAKGYSEVTERWWNRMIQEEAITVVSPYNTFLNPGLPPGPICNPGLSAIKAVLAPESSDYLFFYHKGDGSHAFAVTYEEHLRNEEIYGGGQ